MTAIRPETQIAWEAHLRVHGAPPSQRELERWAKAHGLVGREHIRKEYALLSQEGGCMALDQSHDLEALQALVITQDEAIKSLQTRLSRQEALTRALTKTVEAQAAEHAALKEVIERQHAFLEPIMEMCVRASTGPEKDNVAWRGLRQVQAIMESASPKPDSWGALFATLCNRELPKLY